MECNIDTIWAETKSCPFARITNVLLQNKLNRCMKLPVSAYRCDVTMSVRDVTDDVTEGTVAQLVVFAETERDGLELHAQPLFVQLPLLSETRMLVDITFVNTSCV